MTIQGPWFITRSALEDYGRLLGRRDAPPRAELEAEIIRAHFVKRQGDGSEVWRGSKPLRLRFIVRVGQGVGGDAPQLVRVEGDHSLRELVTARSRPVRLWDGENYRDFEVTDEVNESGGARRVAYRLTCGQWVTAVRGRLRPDHVEGLQEGLANTPSWVRAQRGAAPRRGGRNR